MITTTTKQQHQLLQSQNGQHPHHHLKDEWYNLKRSCSFPGDDNNNNKTTTPATTRIDNTHIFTWRTSDTTWRGPLLSGEAVHLPDSVFTAMKKQTIFKKNQTRYSPSFGNFSRQLTVAGYLENIGDPTWPISAPDETLLLSQFYAELVWRLDLSGPDAYLSNHALLWNKNNKKSIKMCFGGNTEFEQTLEKKAKAVPHKCPGK